MKHSGFFNGILIGKKEYGYRLEKLTAYLEGSPFGVLMKYAYTGYSLGLLTEMDEPGIPHVFNWEVGNLGHLPLFFNGCDKKGNSSDD